jgi:hypothetical protein
MSSTDSTAAAAVAVAAVAATSAPLPTVDPNFSGTWQSLSHSENMYDFLLAKGFSAANARLASAATVVQRIRHTKRRLAVEVGGLMSLYAIPTGHWPSADPVADASEEADDDELSEPADLASAFFGKTAEWIGTRRRRLVVQTGELETEREMQGEMMIVSVSTPGEDGQQIKAKTTFVKKSEVVEFESERKEQQ